MKQKRWSWGLSIFLMLFSSAAIANDEEKVRTWKSRKGQHQIRARLVAYDKDNSTVSLEKEDGTSIEVAMNKLSSTDRRYIEKSKLADSVSDEMNPFAMEQKPSDSGKKNQNRPNELRRAKQLANSQQQELFGIRWSPDLNDALVLAKGEETKRDDRPVMWFRVLGELDGFM